MDADKHGSMNTQIFGLLYAIRVHLCSSAVLFKLFSINSQPQAINLDLPAFTALKNEITAALAGRTTVFKNELALHEEMDLAFTRAGIAFKREVPVKGGGYADFVIRETCVLEVKASGGKGRAPLRQICGYLDSGSFECGLLVVIRAAPLPYSIYQAANGLFLPIAQIELWKNAL